MSFKINTQYAEYFSDKIGYNVTNYLDNWYFWHTNNFPKLVGFYSGRLEEIEVDNFLNSTNLVKESEIITNNVIINKHLLLNLLDWDIFEYLENLKVELWVLSRMDKFLRSTKTNNSYSNSFDFNKTLKPGQTLEHLAFETLNSNNYNNDWTEIALRNDLNEKSYDETGGNSLILSINLNTRTVKINSVVDSIFGERVFGLDLDKNLSFDNDDLKVLSYKGTIFQSVSILSELIKGDVPEFLDLGRSGNVGKNLKQFAINNISRELAEVFSSDDTLTNFFVKSFRYNENNDAILDFTISTRLDLVIDKKILF